MSARSLHGGDLVLRNLEITNELTLADMQLANLDISENLTVSGQTTLQDTTANAITTNGLTATANTGLNAVTANSLVVTDLTSTDLLVNGTSQCQQDVSMNQDLYVAGNVTIGGTVSHQNMPEIVWFHITGDAAQVSETMTLQHNVTGTTNYSVFPSFYYGFTNGGGGTYDLSHTSSSVQGATIISNRTATSFDFIMSKSTGDNWNCCATFLVVYNVPDSDYPSTWS